MRGLRGAAALALALSPAAALRAQRPVLSPPLARVLGRDTTVRVWLFARPEVPLEAAAARIAERGARVRVRSRWLHAVSADAPTAALRLLAGDAAFRRIQPVARWVRPRAAPGAPAPLLPGLETAPQAVLAADTCPAGGDPTYGPSAVPYRALDLGPLAAAGVTGAGARIAILDAGFDTQNPAFAGVDVRAQHDFVFGDSVVRNDSSDDLALDPQFHGTAVWSLFAGDVPGRLVGIARGASYLLAKTEDVRSETRVEEDNYVAALEWADSIGVDVVSSSLGYLAFDNGFSYSPADLNGDVAVTTVAAESASARGILVVTAAGNSGPGFRTLVTPGDGKSVLTIGAEDSLGTIAGFSSRGPTADGRLKPDFTAPGVAVCVVTGTNTMGRLSGTSFATPIVAAAAALVKSLHPALGPHDLRAAFRAYAANRAAPDSIRGWGRPDAAASATFPAGVTAIAPLPPQAATMTPAFQWSVGTPPPFAEPVSYRLRVARSAAFSPALVDTTVSATTVTLPRAFKPDAPVYWRVDATAADGATATTGVIGPVAIPPWVTLRTLSAPGGVTTPDSQPVFRWSSPPAAAPPGPFTYDFFLFRPPATFATYAAGGLTDSSFAIPVPLERDVVYTWAVVAHLGADTSMVRSAGTFLVLDSLAPPVTELYQNFPNPFPAPGRAATCVWFDLAGAASTELAVLDLRGRLVRRIIPGPDFPGYLPAGRYGRSAAGGPTCDVRLTWDGRADDGRLVPPGVYLLKLRAGGQVFFRKIVFSGDPP